MHTFLISVQDITINCVRATAKHKLMASPLSPPRFGFGLRNDVRNDFTPERLPSVDVVIDIASDPRTGGVYAMYRDTRIGYGPVVSKVFISPQRAAPYAFAWNIATTTHIIDELARQR